MEETLDVYRTAGRSVRLVGRLGAASGEFSYDPEYLNSPDAAPDLANDVLPEHMGAFAREIGLSVSRLRQMCGRLAGMTVSSIRKAANSEPSSLDELLSKTDELVEDIEPRRRVLEEVAG